MCVTLAIAAAVVSRLRFSGWNIAIVLSTTGRRQKNPTLAAHTHGDLGASTHASQSTQSALRTIRTTLRICAPRYDVSGSCVYGRVSCQPNTALPSAAAAPATT